jgi:N-methyl-L-tryptophan oxidase
MLLDAHKEWDAFGEKMGHQVLHRSGVVYFSSDLDDPLLKGAKQSADTYKIPKVHLMSGPSVQRRWRGFLTTSHELALYEENGGWLEADTILSMLHQYLRSRIDARYGVRVKEWSCDESGIVRVVTSKGEVRAKSVVISVGAWASKLVPGMVG